MSLQAKIRHGYENSLKLLKLCGLLLDENNLRPLTFSPSKFSSEFISASQSDDYNRIYKTARNHHDYDILLIDQSIFQFSYDLDDNEQIQVIRYAYYETPLDHPTYQEFLIDIGLTYEECGESFYEDYEQVISESHLKNAVTPIRYDYDLPLYRKVNHHPASHIHIGHSNEIRIPMNYILTPLGFVAFIIRQIYRNNWLQALSNDKFYSLYKTLKTCEILNEDNFTREEKEDFYII